MGKASNILVLSKNYNGTRRAIHSQYLQWIVKMGEQVGADWKYAPNILHPVWIKFANNFSKVHVRWFK